MVLVYSERVGAKGDALRRELEIKSLTRSQKLALIDKEKDELGSKSKDPLQLSVGSNELPKRKMSVNAK